MQQKISYLTFPGTRINEEVSVINEQFIKILKQINIYDLFLEELGSLLVDFQNFMNNRIQEYESGLSSYNKHVAEINNHNRNVSKRTKELFQKFKLEVEKNKSTLDYRAINKKVQLRLNEEGLKKLYIPKKYTSLDNFRKQALEDFIKFQNNFKKLLNTHESICDSINSDLIESFLSARIRSFSPYKKNTDFMVTLAFLDLLKKRPELVPNKAFKNTNIVGFATPQKNDEYTIELLKKDELMSGIPFALGTITPCCLNLGATGGNFSLYSILNKNANFLVVKKNGKIISHALIWLSNDEKTLVIDSIDPVQNFADDIIREDNLLVFLYNDFAKEFLGGNPQIEQVNMSLGGNTLKALTTQTSRILNTSTETEKTKSIHHAKDSETNCENITNNGTLADIEYSEEFSSIQLPKTSISQQHQLFETEKPSEDEKILIDLLVKKIVKQTSWSDKVCKRLPYPKDAKLFSMDDSRIHGITFAQQVLMEKQKHSEGRI